MINKVIELYTKSASSEELKAKMAEEIKEYVKPSDYQKIVDEAREETIVKINQNSGLNYQDIVSDMQNSIEIKIGNKVVYKIKECNQELKEKCKRLEGEYEIHQ
ncbi:MAG: hypothetical protein sL5_01850 [Candidatus Mesenet longicola]|uniref:Uncharacterized protein n=1 Tax=Candidatus Mesenet longicola TaxID=1892558 RepID=A0A8J3MMH1_9RICK|nr:MAG: hypothetical protein sGL2_01540 [Candidatus Mesenet longicola]GHM59192.1 MAG: hypothetical protein sL5_01850 [Candidatus Mesenet longicola]